MHTQPPIQPSRDSKHKDHTDFPQLPALRQNSTQALKPPESLEMFYKVDENAYRSAMPTKPEEFTFLKEVGIKTIISLQQLGEHGKTLAQSTGLKVIDYPLEEDEVPTKQQVNEFLEIIGRELDEKNKVLIHCDEGKQRTGLMVGFYLIRYQGMDPHRAYVEADKRYLGDTPEFKEFLLKHGEEIRKRK